MTTGEYTRILGVDPGLHRTGWGLIACDANTLRVMDKGVIMTKATTDFSARLLEIFEGLQAVIEQYVPEIVAVEDVIYAENVRVALKLGHARGSVLLAAAAKNVPVVSYAPKEIKESLTGNGSASKVQMQRMVQSILGLPELPSPHDVADAIAVALCHFHRYSMQARFRSTS